MAEGSLTWLPEALKKEGLTVKLVAGWRTRGRPGTFRPGAVMFHHTASSPRGGNAPALGICTHGRAGIPGPLCQLLVARNGVVYVIAAGRANHAGLGGPWRNVPRDSGNAYSIGVEVENSGTGERWSSELLDACSRVFAAILKHERLTSSRLLGHKEWAPRRKIDPHPVSMDGARAAVSRRLGGSAPPRPPAPPKPAARLLRLTSPYMRGSDVLDLQKALKARGYSLTADGIFGPQTDRAVKVFQSRNGLAVDGIVGQRTRAKLGL